MSSVRSDSRSPSFCCSALPPQRPLTTQSCIAMTVLDADTTEDTLAPKFSAEKFPGPQPPAAPSHPLPYVFNPPTPSDGGPGDRRDSGCAGDVGCLPLRLSEAVSDDESDRFVASTDKLDDDFFQSPTSAQQHPVARETPPWRPRYRPRHGPVLR